MAKSAKWWMGWLAAAVLAGGAPGAEITPDQAEQAALNWVARGQALGKIPPGRAVAGVDELAEPETGARLHVVRFEGGGFVVLSADDLVDPVLAFSGTGETLEPDDGNPFWALLRRDIAAREAAAGIERGAAGRPSGTRVARTAGGAGKRADAARRRWASLLDSSGSSGNPRGGARSIATGALSDIRVDSFVKSRWSQSTAGGTNCYNYYTPNHSVCGCTATAIGQIMRHWEYPTASVASRTYPCEVDGVKTSKTMMGGVYDWANMPFAPSWSNPPSEPECRAIGKLLYDVGVAVGMSWTRDASSANLEMDGALALRSDFGYANAVALCYYVPSYPWSLAEFKKAVIPNLDARCPVGLSIYGSAGGHSVVADGYGYSDGDFFVHVNFGWAGSSDAWYCPPGMDDFSAIDSLLCNVHPRTAGSILSGRVLDSRKLPVENASVSLSSGNTVLATATTDRNGIYAFISDRTGTLTVKAAHGRLAGSASATLGKTVSYVTGTHADPDWNTTCANGNSPGNEVVLSGEVPRIVAVSLDDRGGTGGSGEVSATYGQALPAVAVPERPGFVFGGYYTAVNGGGTQYYTAAGAGARTWDRPGDTELCAKWTFHDPDSRDAFADARRLDGVSGTSIFLNAGYTVEEGEPYSPSGCASAWAEWTAPADGMWRMTLSGVDDGLSPSRIWTYLGVYTGDAVSSLAAVATSSGYGPKAEFRATAGTTYHVAMTTRSAGILTLDWTRGDVVTLDRQNGYSYKPTVLAVFGEEMPAVAVPTKTGHAFEGYFSGTNGTGTRYYTAAGTSARTWDRTGDATLYAHWTPNTYTATLDRQGGAGGTESVSATYGEVPPPVKIPAREGSDFAGYFVGGDGTGAQYYNAAGAGTRTWNIASNATLHAHWMEKADVAWEYRIENGRAVVTNATPARGKLAIPEELGGCPVGGVGAGAFQGATNLLSIVIPEGVENIGNSAFYNCGKLVSAAIPASATNIGSSAFRSCIGLMAAEIPANVKKIGSRAFYGCSGLASLALPEGVEDIGSYAFYGCSGLASVVIPDSVTNVGHSAFAACGGLERLEVPGAWWGTDNVANAGVPEGCVVVYRGLHPLAVATEELPAGMAGEAYETVLEAEGGVEPYAWREGLADYAEEETAEGYEETGTARGWQADDGCWNWELPFAFPFFGHARTNAKINVNGAISFGNADFAAYSYSEGTFKATPAIAVLWNDLDMTGGDVYTEAGDDWAMVQWRGTYYSGGAANCSATLRRDGTIELAYGDGNEQGGAIGISAGDGVAWMLSEKSWRNMGHAADIVFRPGEGMPGWLELTPEGRLRGTPAADGEYAFAVVVADAAGVAVRRELVLEVQPLVSQRVTFDANGGTCGTAAGEYAVGEPYGNLPEAEREGFVFVGWFTMPEGGALVTADTVVPGVAARKLWAHWGVPDLSACAPEGWPAAIFLAAEAGSTVALAEAWTRETAYLNFAYANAGTAAAGAHRVEGVVKDSEGTVVANWSWSLPPLGTNACRMVTNVALSVATAGDYAVAVTLDAGGEVSEGDEGNNEMRLSFAAAARQRVTFDANGGTCAATNRVCPVGKPYGELPEATRDGYACEGWFTAAAGGAQVTAESPVTEEEERTLWAHWRGNVYLVALDGQGGTGGTTNVAATYDAAMPAISVPTRPGYAFGGYYAAKNGGGARYYTETGASARTWDKTAGATLYAQWTANAYEVTLDPQGGTGGTASVTATFGAAMPEIEVPKKAGHEFLGYFSGRNGTGTQYYSASGESCRAWNLTEAATLFAHWVEPKTVWRFYSDDTRGHFFTISESEKDKLVATSKTWQFEGGAYRAYTSQVAGTVPLYRFWSDQIRGHFFTISESEKNRLIATSKTWKYEGIAYHVYPAKVEGTVAVYRFWSDAVQHHFYTVSETERDKLRKGKTWSYEGIAFWALPREESSGSEEPEEPEEPEAELQTVWRFYSDATRGHFFTISAAEKEKLRTTSKTWQFEGAAYRAYTGAAEGTVPLYRFWSDQIQGHFFTISESEKNRLIATSKTWKYEGIAYHVYPKEVAGSVAVYRFWSDAVQHHFYTVSASERDSLRKGKTWSYEGIAFWALPQSQAKGGSKVLPKATPEQRETGTSIGKKSVAHRGVAVTTSDGSDGSAVADGDEETGWAPEGEGLAWVILSLPEPVEVAAVEVSGENLPETIRVLLSKDAEEWFEGEGGSAGYVWVAWEGEGTVVREIRVESGE